MWSWLDRELEALERDGLGRSLLTLEGLAGASIALEGRPLLNFASNDYLGLANAAATREALLSGTAEYGAGAGASRLVTGNFAVHERAEKALAEYVAQPSALLFSSGYAANVSLLSALARKGDAVFSDALNHASIIDGVRLSRAARFVYPHGDIEALRELLVETGVRGRRFIVTESVFSMDGDRAPLRQLRALADQFDCVLIVDDAHALGVLGPKGAGLAHGIAHVTVGTLGKAFGLWGAFVAGPQTLRRWLIHRARGFVFSTAVPPALASSVLTMLDVVRGAEAERDRVLSYAQRIAAAKGAEQESAIVSWRLEGDDVVRALDLERRLRARGLLIRPMRPPTVPEGTARLRIVPSAAHTLEDIDTLLAALQECGA